MTEAPDPASVGEDTELVLRLCYRARWNADTEQADHWVDFPKSSDPDEDHFVRVARALRLVLPFVTAAPEGRPLGLSARSAFRGLVEQTKGGDLAEAVAGLLDSLETAAAQFSSSEQVANALDSVLASVRPLLRVVGRGATELVSFLPDGGSVSGVLRSLGAAVELPGGPTLPLAHHGSTTTALFAAGELLAGSGSPDTVVAVDDFGEDLDGAASAHLAATLRAKPGQVWLGTRRSAVAEAFPTEEIVRLVRPRANVARLHQGRTPRTRAERTASRHLALQLLPAMASTTVALLEGPHDRNALAAVARRRFEEEDVPLPAAHRISLADAGAADGSGGASKVVKLARYAGELGFRVVGVLDGDEAGDTATADADAVTDAVIQLPRGVAIEKALLVGLDDDVIRTALTNLAAEFGASLPPTVASANGNDLVRLGCDVIKSSGGLHAQFVDLLPAGSLPPLVAKLLDTIVAAGTGKQKGTVSL